MIKQLSISNFQSHKKTTLEFSEGISVIIGQSDSGKSAILRALNWVINNKPGGEAFRSNWGGDTEVILELEDEGEVLRYRTKKVPNGYQIHYPAKEKKKTGKVANTFRSFGQNVPEEIKQIINFSSLNLQGQHDAPFLLALSGGEVAKYLNQIVNLDKIDSSLSNIGKLLRKEQTDLKHKEDDYNESNIKLKEYNWIDEAEGYLEELELFERNLKHKNEKASKLTRYINGLITIDEQLTELPDLTKYALQVEKLLDDQRVLVLKKTKLIKLQDKLKWIRECEEQIEFEEGLLKTNEKEFKQLMPQQCPLCGK